MILSQVEATMALVPVESDSEAGNYWLSHNKPLC